jgi:hypothetical protein
MSISSWVFVALGALVLLFALWIGYHLLRIRRLRPIVLEFLAVQAVEQALQYIEGHPRLLDPEAELVARAHLNRAWDRGEVVTFVSGIVRVALLVGCQKHGAETVRELSTGGFQAQFDAINSPAWQRAMELLAQARAEQAFSVPEDEVDEELVEAMDQLTAMLRPLVTERTDATMDALMDVLRQILAQKRGA